MQNCKEKEPPMEALTKREFYRGITLLAYSIFIPALILLWNNDAVNPYAVMVAGATHILIMLWIEFKYLL